MSQTESYYVEHVVTYGGPLSVTPTTAVAVAPSSVSDTTSSETIGVNTDMQLAPTQEDVVVRISIPRDGRVKVRLQGWQGGVSRLQQMHGDAWAAYHRDYPHGFTLKRGRGGQNVISDISFMAAAHMLCANPAEDSPSPSPRHSHKATKACIRHRADIARAFLNGEMRR
jgi:hypothetical protein